MVKGFEELTVKLSKEEKNIVPAIVRLIKKHKKKNPIKSYEILEFINDKYEQKLDSPLDGVRFRKMCNLIRSRGILPVIATSRGYYVSYDNEEIQFQIDSLHARASAIRNSANGLKKFITD